MKKIVFLFLLFLAPKFVVAGEWDSEFSLHAKTLYGWSSTKKHHHGVADANFDSSVTYFFDNGSNFSLNFGLDGGIDRELQSYNQGHWGEEIYAAYDGSFGQFMLGQVYNVAYLFHNGAQTTGAIESNFDVVDFIANPNWKRNSKETYFATLTSTEINTDGVAPKFNYISPEFYGTAIGFSYMPDAYNRRGLINKHAGYANKDGFVAAIYNDMDWGAFSSQASFGYAQYHSNDKEFSYSLKLQKGNWSVGGGFRKTYSDGKNKSAPNRYLKEGFDDYREGQAWNVGIGYEFGPFSSTLSYFESESNLSDNNNKIVVFSNQLQLNKSMDVFVAASHVDYDNSFDATSGYALITGLGVRF